MGGKRKIIANAAEKNLFLSKCGKKYEIWTKTTAILSKCGKKSEIWTKTAWWLQILSINLHC